MKLTDPYFLQSACNRPRVQGGKIVMQFSVDDPGQLFFCQDEESSFVNFDCQVTATKNGVKTTTEYEGVQVVDIEADANTDIIINGDFSAAYSFVTNYMNQSFDSCTRFHLDCAGFSLVFVVAPSLLDLELTGREAVKELFLNNARSEFSFDGFQALESASLTLENLTSIDLTPATALRDVYFNMKSLASIDLSVRPELTRVELQAPLTTLDLSHNPAVTEVNLYKLTQLETLDMSGCELIDDFQRTDITAIKTVKYRAINQTPSNLVASMITQADANDGTVYLNSADPYYQTVADAATAKGWTVLDL